METSLRVLILAAIAAFGGVVMGYGAVQLYFLPQGVAERELNRVPNLSGIDLDEARERGESEGYVVIVGGERSSSTVNAGDVVYQVPPPGFYSPRGDTIRVLVSRGHDAIEVPDLAGLEAGVATAVVRRLGLRTTPPRRQTSELHPLGRVVETVPPAGTPIEAGEPVTLVLSGGGSLMTMPDVTGLTLTAARDTLEIHGLIVGDVGRVGEERAGEGAPVVVRQTPTRGSRVRTGAAVRLELGGGETR